MKSRASSVAIERNQLSVLRVTTLAFLSGWDIGVARRGVIGLFLLFKLLGSQVMLTSLGISIVVFTVVRRIATLKMFSLHIVHSLRMWPPIALVARLTLTTFSLLPVSLVRILFQLATKSAIRLLVVGIFAPKHATMEIVAYV